MQFVYVFADFVILEKLLHHASLSVSGQTTRADRRQLMGAYLSLWGLLCGTSFFVGSGQVRPVAGDC